MAINIFNLKKWWKMATGKSVLHVVQGAGQCYSPDKISGYYNDLTGKVLIQPELLNSGELPMVVAENGSRIIFPVAVFQYGLGAYDLYLTTGDNRYLKKFEQCYLWALEHIDSEGRWDNFFYIFPDNRYGAMAQGEGASLLIRGYLHSGNAELLQAAKKAIDFMLLPISDGGTTLFSHNDVVFMEYTHLKPVLNGWIFAWWGLYDYVVVSDNKDAYKDLLDRSLQTLLRKLPQFGIGFWSKYSLDGKVASPFYHNLHIAQMKAMYSLTGKPAFAEVEQRWARQQRNPIYKSMAVIRKAFQKIAE